MGILTASRCYIVPFGAIRYRSWRPTFEIEAVGLYWFPYLNKHFKKASRHVHPKTLGSPPPSIVDWDGGWCFVLAVFAYGLEVGHAGFDGLECGGWFLFGVDCLADAAGDA
jgi:hypothetical protein